MKSLEIEIKFYIPDIDSIRARIRSLGAEPKSSGFETNIRFDDKEMHLTQEKKLLRLRQDTRCRLTVKSPPEDADTEFKIFRELEVDISNSQTMIAILGQLGFYPRQVYEKQRETYLFNHTELCLDTLPYGHFLEIEGGKDDIRKAAEAIGLPWGKRITANYLSLFATLQKQLNLPFEDVTFENFKQTGIDKSRIHKILEEGVSPL
ncbi:MAG: class IV adenylate cyclase [Deltaproteobacteria bacterium]|nr:class IV adenylate cyclase [Deltaproteobacteria bacterium]